MGIDVDASELRNLGIEIQVKTDEVSPEVRSGMARIGFAIERSAKLGAPVDTGNLRASISTDAGGTATGGFEVVVSATTEYADYVEYGTTRMAGQPYMGPAFDQHAPTIFVVLSDAGLRL